MGMTGCRQTTTALALAGLAITGACSRTSAPAPRFDVGRPAAPAEIQAWDVDVNGSGDGLPAGSGSVALGREVYARACAMCHGANGEGGGGSRLVHQTGGPPRRSIASHWPYAPPLFDYIRRTMPPAAPWSLTNDEVYGLLAYLLAENGIVPPAVQMDAAALRAVVMPARARFVPDDRRGGPVVR